MKPLAINASSYNQITAHAVERFPSECCGFIIERAGHEEVVRIRNVQDELHALYPDTYTRTSALAYTMASDEYKIRRAHERGELVIRAIYHSHPQHDAYFSEEDQRNAVSEGEPTFPSAGQIVVSVYDRVYKGAKAFRWDAAKKEYVETPLEVAATQASPAAGG